MATALDAVAVMTVPTIGLGRLPGEPSSSHPCRTGKLPWQSPTAPQSSYLEILLKIQHLGFRVAEL